MLTTSITGMSITVDCSCKWYQWALSRFPLLDRYLVDGFLQRLTSVMFNNSVNVAFSFFPNIRFCNDSTGPPVTHTLFCIVAFRTPRLLANCSVDGHSLDSPVLISVTRIRDWLSRSGYLSLLNWFIAFHVGYIQILLITQFVIIESPESSTFGRSLLSYPVRDSCLRNI